jgi:deoxyribonucleoside regulator
MGERELSRRDLMVMVAKMYYYEHLSQEEIAAKIHLSRPSVSRMLSACEAEGIVQIRIDDASTLGMELSQSIKERYGLKEVIVVPQGRNPDEDKLRAGTAAAEYLGKNLKSSMLVGIAWGTTIYNMVRAIVPNTQIKADVIQLVGGVGNVTTDTDAASMTMALARALNGDSLLLQAPLMVQTKILRDLLMEEPHVKAHYEKFSHVDIAIVGLGSTQPELSAQYRSGHITYEDTQRLIREGAVGDICGSYIDIEGRSCHTSLSDRMIAITLEQMKNIPVVIGVATGEKKADIITGALRGRYIDVLITNEPAALGVVGLERG